MDRVFEVNGVRVEAHFEEESVETALKPLLREILRRAEEVTGRMIVLLAAPPAAGKTTLCLFLQELAKEMGGKPVQALGMDGFHYHQERILASTVMRDGREVPMASVKGAPDSFDAEKLRGTLEAIRRGEDVRFPVYDRRMHDVVEEAVAVKGEVLLIEGNWLLLDEERWRGLPCDYSVFVEAEEGLLRERVLARRAATGRTREEALALYESSDGPNIRLCLERSAQADVRLKMTGDGEYESM